LISFLFFTVVFNIDGAGAIPSHTTNTVHVFTVVNTQAKISIISLIDNPFLHVSHCGCEDDAGL
jgi:hypothetical protein